MNIQEINNVQMKTEIKLENDSENHEYLFNSERNNQIILNKFNERETKDECSNQLQSAQEETGFKTQLQEDQGNSRPLVINIDEDISPEKSDEVLLFKCNDCTYYSYNKSNLSRHQVLKHLRKRDGNSTCLLCQKSLKDKSALDAHYLAIHPDASDRWKDILTHKIHKCAKCDYKAVRQSTLKRHMLEVHEPSTGQPNLKYGQNTPGNKNKKYSCILCQKLFRDKLSLDSHYVAIHLDESDRWKDRLMHAVNKCVKCDFKAVRVSDMRRHVATHETPVAGQSKAEHKAKSKCDVKPKCNLKLKCDICGIECNRDYLTRHMRLHTADRLPFACTECDKSFNQKIQLWGHIVTWHSNNETLMNSVVVYQCDYCDYKTAIKNSMKCHVTRCEFKRKSENVFKTDILNTTRKKLNATFRISNQERLV